MTHTQFAALGDPLRWHIVQLLIKHDGNICVERLVELINEFEPPRSQSNISHHLRILRLAGLITAENATTYHFYRVRMDTLAEVEQALAQLHTVRVDSEATA